MKNKKRNIKQQKIYKRRRIALVCILVLLAIILILNINSKRNLNKVALGENALNIGGDTLDLSEVLSQDPNAPHLGAGMIPIKWNGSNWVITTATDENWYDYSKGNWANVMLSDGIYSSELERGKKLASDFVGASITRSEDLGTIFTWIPRLAYSDSEVEFLKNLSLLEFNWTTESCFNLEGYGANYIDLAFSGIWVGQTEFANLQDLENKNNEMSSKENVQGLIANERITNIEESEKTAIQKLLEKYSVTQNRTMISNVDSINFRQVIKIVNTNNRMPIMATHIMLGDRIKITDKYSAYGIKFITDKDGNKLDLGQTPIDENNTAYTFYLVDNIGNIRKYTMNYGTGKPNLKGFNQNTTYYVSYDSNGNASSEIPIGEMEPQDWYDYENQRWANIVVRDNGNTNYYVWIPRYMYTLDDENQKVNAKFVDLNNVWTDTEHGGKQVDLNRSEYKLPEAFTWEDPNDENNKIQLPGFWISKYELRDGSDTLPKIYGGFGSIKISNIKEATNSNYICEMYLIKDGKRIILDENSNTYIQGTNPITLKGDYEYTNLETGRYAINIIIKDKQTGLEINAITKEVSIADKSDLNGPNLDGFNIAHTYYVVYDEFGNEDSSIPIGNQDAPSNWYEYGFSRWANIVVRENGNENYYVWIPRYQYNLNDTEQKANVVFTKNDTADDGYQIPEAFTWEDPNDANNKIQLPGFWISKYELRDGATTLPDIYGTGETITINGIATNSSYKYYAYVISEEGKIVHQKEITSEDNKITNVAPGNYIVNVITKDATGRHIGAASRDILVLSKTQSYPPDLSSYNINTTFYVNYDVLGIEGDNTTPISMQMSDWPENWYNYEFDEFKKATVVVREKDTEIYYEWIPRYECPINSPTQRTYIDTDKTEPDVGFIIPPEFTDLEGNALKGYWSKKTTYTNRISANIIAGEDTITINNITSTSKTIGTYIYLIQNGEIKQHQYVPLDLSYTFSGLEKGAYTVLLVKKSTSGLLTEAGMTQDVTVTIVEEPNLDGFNPETTYYVTYNEEGNEILTPLSSGIDKNKWYNYPEHRWANILTKDTLEDGTEVKNYFVWIPRYEYTTNNSTQKAIVRFIPQTQEIADRGYKIPESFTWEDPNDANNKIQLKGFWISKYELR